MKRSVKHAGFREYFPIGCTSTMRLRSLRWRSGELVADAVVTGVLVNGSNRPVTDATPIEFTATPGRPGDYAGRFQVPASLRPHHHYAVIVTVTHGDRTATWMVRRLALHNPA